MLYIRKTIRDIIHYDYSAGTYNDVRCASVSSNPCTLLHLTSVSERRRNPVAPTPVKCLRVHRAIRPTMTKSGPQKFGCFLVSWPSFEILRVLSYIISNLTGYRGPKARLLISLLDISYPSRYRRIIMTREINSKISVFNSRRRWSPVRFDYRDVQRRGSESLDANRRAENGHRVFQGVARWHECTG